MASSVVMLEISSLFSTGAISELLYPRTVSAATTSFMAPPV